MSLSVPSNTGGGQRQRGGFLLVPTDRLASAFATPPRPIDPADEEQALEPPTKPQSQPATSTEDDTPMFVISAETPMEPVSRSD